MRSAKGSVHVWTRLRPRLSSGDGISGVPFPCACGCNWLLEGLSSGIETCRVPLLPTEGVNKGYGERNPTGSEERRYFIEASSSLSSMDLSSKSMPALSRWGDSLLPIFRSCETKDGQRESLLRGAHISLTIIRQEQNL
jgi:hypothetical protein